jgi:hypothetical protein
MIIEMVLVLAFVVAIGAIMVKAYEWRQDVFTALISFRLYLIGSNSHPHMAKQDVGYLLYALSGKGSRQQRLMRGKNNRHSLAI